MPSEKEPTVVGRIVPMWGVSVPECIKELEDKHREGSLPDNLPKWQTIETAPKDGSVILGYDGEDVLSMKWYKTKYVPPRGGRWEVTVDEDFYFEPTHWIPLSLPDPLYVATPTYHKSQYRRY